MLHANTVETWLRRQTWPLSILCFIILLDTNEDQSVQKTFMFLTEDMNAVTEPIKSSGVYFGIQSSGQ